MAFGWIQRTGYLVVLVQNSTNLSGDDFRGPHLGPPVRTRFAITHGPESGCASLIGEILRNLSALYFAGFMEVRLNIAYVDRSGAFGSSRYLLPRKTSPAKTAISTTKPPATTNACLKCSISGLIGLRLFARPSSLTLDGLGKSSSIASALG